MGAPRVCAIAAPLLNVATSLDEGATIERLFGPAVDATLVGVFARSQPAEPVVDLRDGADPVPALSLDWARGDRQHTDEIGALVVDAIDTTEAATVAIGLGLQGGDDLEASDAALRARRLARPRIRWICYSAAASEGDAARVARRRMALFMRGIRLEPVAVPDAPMGSSARFWEIRAPHRY